jgi:hypothetical protein
MKTLTKEKGSLTVAVAGGAATLQVSADGWEQVTEASGFNRTFINRSYIDLAGMSAEAKTLFFEAAAIQDAGLPSVSPATVGQLTSVIDIMSNKPISTDEALDLHQFGNITNINSNTQLTFDQSIYFRMRRYNIDVDNLAAGFQVKISDDQLGSLSPTATDRLYCTRIVVLGEVDGIYIVYPARYVVRVVAKEEPEYQYMMRLKRSYELQNEPDRD